MDTQTDERMDDGGTKYLIEVLVRNEQVTRGHNIVALLMLFDTNQQTDGPTGGPMDGPTDGQSSYGAANPQLRKKQTKGES